MKYYIKLLLHENSPILDLFPLQPVREEAILLIGNMSNVSEAIMEQTLDKKLMSNMRVKKSSHQREASLVSAGEWSSGEALLNYLLLSFGQNH